MKIYLRSVLAIFLIMVVTDLDAQMKSGYIFGLNLSTVTLKTNVYTSTPKTPVSIHFGVIYDIPIKRRLSFQSGLLFSAKGSDYVIDTADISISPVYLEMPVLAVYSFGSENFKISLFGGPYFACGIGGYKIVSGGELTYLRFGAGRSNDLKPFDVGLNFGAGVTVRGFRISAQYGIGLKNITHVTSEISEMKNKVIGISVSSLMAHK